LVEAKAFLMVEVAVFYGPGFERVLNPGKVTGVSNPHDGVKLGGGLGKRYEQKRKGEGLRFPPRKSEIVCG
jgi:hypothetical protein